MNHTQSITKIKKMKTTTLLILSTLLLASACNTDEDDIITDDDVSMSEYIYEGCIPSKREIRQIASEDVIQVFDYIYDNGKLSRIDNSWGYRNEFEYDGLLVIKITNYDSLNQIVSTADYEYDDNNKLIKQQYYNNVNDTLNLTYDISYSYSGGVLSKSSFINLGKSYLIFFDDLGINIDSVLHFSPTGIALERRIFEWDNKPSPFSNLSTPLLGFFANPYPSNQNLVSSENYTYDETGELLQFGSSNQIVQEYNDFDFPVEYEFSNANTIGMTYLNCE